MNKLRSNDLSPQNDSLSIVIGKTMQSLKNYDKYLSFSFTLLTFNIPHDWHFIHGKCRGNLTLQVTGFEVGFFSLFTFFTKLIAQATRENRWNTFFFGSKFTIFGCPPQIVSSPSSDKIHSNPLLEVRTHKGNPFPRSIL